MDKVSAKRPGGHWFDPHCESILVIPPKNPSTGSRPRKRTRERFNKPASFDAIELK
ncbi:hypothetical protein DPMN_108348 [Dreissena polymorpha]|uniref:Uncharacterized protein n=1 Tax=Dreissena polymorpha TaxID=45954 RepID=A0A9D4K8D1_DREPO|nr:hypothetical protein DPMN_108348 [Dreissena polymorpha]